MRPSGPWWRRGTWLGLVLWLAGLCYAEPGATKPVSLRATPERITPERIAVVAEEGGPTTESDGLLAGLLDRSGTSVRGYLRNETAYRYVQPAAFSKVLNVLRMETTTPIGDMMELSMVPRFTYDSVYDIEDVDTIHPRRGPTTILSQEQDAGTLSQINAENVRLVQIEQSSAELREIYLDVHFDVVDLRVGRQIVRWGVVEGARITDEINPLDFKEFILREVVDRYVPLTMVRLDYYLDASSVQFLWIPEVQTHIPAPVGTEFEQFQFLPGFVPRDSGIRNAEWALKYNFSAYEVDLAVSYFDTWDDFPAAFRTIAPQEFAVDPQVDFVPSPPRLNIWGLAASRALGPAILSFEWAYVHNKLFGVFNEGVDPLPDEEDGEVQRDFVKWALNVDFTWLGTDWSLQYLEADIIGYDRPIIADKRDVVHALFVRRTFFNNLVTAQMLAIRFVNDAEWVIRPRMDMLMTERVKLSFGADVMTGDIADTGPRGEPLPGQFHFAGFFQNSSRLYMELAYQF